MKKERELGIVWYLIPVVWVVAALAGFLALSSWPTLVADPLRARAAAGPALPAPVVDTGVPAAADVFKSRGYEATEHIEAF